MNPIRRPPRRGFGGSSAFAPAELFRNGVTGVWFDPSDLSTMFQDAAGTTPVTAADQPVGLMLDQSGNGNHISQLTDAQRPMLRTDGRLWWLEFDGVDDYISKAADPIAANKSLTICIATACADVDGNKRAFLGIGQNGTGHHVSHGASFNNNYYVYSDGLVPARNAYTITNYVSDTNSFISTHTLELGRNIAVTKNKTAIEVSQADVLAARTSVTPVFTIGRRPDVPYYFSGKIFSLCVVEGVLSGNLLNQVSAFMAKRAGVTL